MLLLVEARQLRFSKNTSKTKQVPRNRYPSPPRFAEGGDCRSNCSKLDG